MKFTLRQLDIFLAVAREKNISRAAGSLHMSQSAASASILNLENHYGVELFERGGNRLTLSPIGSTLRREAEAVMAHCKHFENLLQNHEKVGHLKVGASFTIGNHLASRYLASYLLDNPDAEVELEIANTPEVVAKVLNYEVDIGLIEGESKQRNLELIPWQEDELVVFCAASHPLAKKKSLSAKDIKSARWILRETDSGARQTFDRAMADFLPEINIFLEFRHNEAIKNAVETGLGIGCLSQLVLQKNLANGDLVPLAVPSKQLRRTFYFALPRNRYRKPAIDTWMSICRQSGQ